MNTEDCFVHIVPTQPELAGYRYTVRATTSYGAPCGSLKEIILCQTNNLDESFDIFAANQGRYHTLCWSINHEVNEQPQEDLSILDRLGRWLRKLWPTK
jgi:hypothetical protein